MGGFFIEEMSGVEYEIYNEDCLQGMKRIADGTVDCIICDPPYQTTDCAWDQRLPLEEMWAQFNRVTKHNAAIVLFAQLPFAVDVINANRKMFRYEWVFHKSKAVGFLNANKMPLRAHENILVFYRALPTYNPQFRTGKPYVSAHRDEESGRVYRQRRGGVTINDGTRYYPRDVLEFKSVSNSREEPQVHPTQKPVALLEYLIQTYTNSWELVLDATMGSGSTGVACINTGRKFIGYELDAKYYDISKQRLELAMAAKRARLF